MEASLDLVVLAPDGVGIRNFLWGGFLEGAAARHRVRLLHRIPPGLLTQVGPALPPTVSEHQLLCYDEPASLYVLRYALAYAHMEWADTFAMRRNRQRPRGGSARARAAQRAAKAIGHAAAHPLGIRLLERCQTAAAKRLQVVARYRRLLEDWRPNVLFCTNQKLPDVLAPVLAARSLGIPTATFIFSWDNLTTKGRIAAPFEHFLVWSELMRNELVRYYPEVAPECVHVVGTPQFAPYRQAELRSTREEFFRTIGADPGRPLICYSGGDVSTVPEDQEYVRVLMELVRSGQIPGQPQVLVRPSPVDPGERYARVRRDFPELLYQQPAWLHPQRGNTYATLPLPSDVSFLVNVTAHSSVNVNVASTMTLDFALNDKPVVNVAFDVSDPPPFGVALWDHYYQFEHYQPVVRLGAARVGRSPGELAQHIAAYLAHPELDREARRRLVQLEVGLPPEDSNGAILAVLERIAR